MKNKVKDFSELKTGEQVKETANEILEGSKKAAFAHDSDQALFVMVVIDCSHSVQAANAFDIYNQILPTMIEKFTEYPDALAKIKIGVIRYGTEVEVVTDYIPVHEYVPDTNICRDMKLTDSAAALEKAFELTEEAMYYYQSELGAKILKGIVIHVTDGLPTSESEEMDRVASIYNGYVRSNGKKRIENYVVTQNEDAFKAVENYADKTFMTEDYEGLVNALKDVAEMASIMSTLDVRYNSETGEFDIDTSQAGTMELTEDIKQVRTLDLSQTL